MDVVDLPLEQLIPYARNPRKNAAAVATVAASLKEFGWRQPIVVDEEMVILAGHTRLEAARQLGMKTAPVHIARGLTPAQARAYRLMDNRASENAEWDEALLGLELGDLQGDGFDLALTGFGDESLTACRLGSGTKPTAREGEDEVPEAPRSWSAGPAISDRPLPSSIDRPALVIVHPGAAAPGPSIQIRAQCELVRAWPGSLFVLDDGKPFPDAPFDARLHDVLSDAIDMREHTSLRCRIAATEVGSSPRSSACSNSPPAAISC
jgi:ParB-like nuclease family protein